jgi:hypothetical protein
MSGMKSCTPHSTLLFLHEPLAGQGVPWAVERDPRRIERMLNDSAQAVRDAVNAGWSQDGA